MLFAALLMGCAGCGQPDEKQRAFARAPEALEQSGRFGFVTLSLQQPAAGMAVSSRLVARAHFVAHSGLDRNETLQLLGLPPWLQLNPTGRCDLTWHRLDALQPAAAGDVWVELMDAGDIGLMVGPRSRTLESKYFPDVLPFVSGLTYEAVIGSVPNSPDLPVTLLGEGGGDVGRFETTVRIPSRFRFVSVGDLPARHRVAMPIAWGSDLQVRWQPGEPPQEAVFLELTRRTFDMLYTARCTVRDDGLFAIPGAIIALLPEVARPATDRLAGRRVRSTAFDAPGLDEGWVFAVSEDSVLLD